MRIIAAATILIAGSLCAACGQSSSPLAPSTHTQQSPVTSVTVRTLDASTHAALPGITITLSGSQSSAVRTTDAAGAALLPAFVGDSIIIDVRSDDYAPMSAAGILSGPSERWTFYLSHVN